MSRRARAVFGRFGVAAVVAATVITTAAVGASAAGGGHFTTPPAGTKVTGNLKTGTFMVFKGTINGIPITVNCKTFTSTGKIPAKGLSITIKVPTIKGCTDSIGGTDTLVSNQTNGKWKTTETIAPGGDTVKLVIPKDGATFTSSLLPACTLTAEPSAAGSVAGPYDNVNTVTVTNGKIPLSSSGCSASSSTVSATVVFSPNVSGAS
jgi:hypothetical protein